MTRLAILLSTVAAVAFAADPPALRPPQSVEPLRYSAVLTLDPSKPDFAGDITISVRVKDPGVSLFWLNGTGVEIKSANVEANGRTLTAKIVPGGEDFIGLQFDAPLPVGPARLTAAYTAKVNTKSSAGVFSNKVGDDRYLFTQFEPFDARRAFPCFDEPAYKVPWQLTLRVPKGNEAFANTSPVSDKTEGDYRIIQFGETKPLPSYLIAFAVGPLETVDAGRAGRNKFPVRIIVPRGTRDQAKYAASITAEILTRLEDYFGIPYPYDKSDSIAIPISFGGAMENPGLVTYNQTIILAKPGQESVQFQRGYASVAAHELAHQWFGDLVTMAWWNDTWLNEGFATWMSSKLIGMWKPQWHTDVNDQQAKQFAMGQDSLVTARRINQPAESKSDIANAFDGITYQKGGAVIHMFEQAMGEEKFRNGVRQYLKQHAFGNARTEDFLAALSDAGGKEIAPAFATFLNQAGVPEVKVELNCAQGQKPQLALSQQRLLPLGSSGSVDQTWRIPFCVTYANGSKRERECAMVGTSKAELELKKAGSCPAWVLPNAGGAGYYRVNYNGDLLKNLFGHREALTIAEQVNVIGDVVALTRTGTLPASDALDLVPAVASDIHHQIVEQALAIATGLTQPQLLGDDLRPKRVHFIQSAFGDRARKLGWQPRPGESEDDRLLRPSLVGTVANAGEDAALIQEAKQLAERWLADRKSVAPDLVGRVLDTAARHSDEAFYDKVLAAAKREQDPRDRQRLIGALGSFTDPALIRRNFALVLEGAFDLRESFGLFFGPLDSRATQRMPLEFTIDHFDELAAKAPSSVGSAYMAVLPRLASVGCSEKDRAEAEAFFGPKMAKVTGGQRSLAQTLEGIHLCEAWKNAQQESVQRFLAKY